MREKLDPCELCGKHDRLKNVIIEGSILSVCSKCSSFGKAIKLSNKKETTAIVPRKIKIETTVEIINPEYSRLIKDAREKLNLKQEELAQKISERESVIQHLEAGKLEPSLQLARKLERFLNIKLIEEYSEPSDKTINLADSSVTIGDLIKMKKNE